MMMPANYSVIAENEMTYVTGGGVIANVLPAVMTEANWKKFTTNLVMITGNGFMKKFLNATLETIFNGDYSFGNVTTGIFDNLSTVAGGKDVTPKGVLNAALQVVGGLASIYALGQGDVAMALPKDYVLPVA